MFEHQAILDKMEALQANPAVSNEMKILIQAFRAHADAVDRRLKELEDLTRQMKQQRMMN